MVHLDHPGHPDLPGTVMDNVAVTKETLEQALLETLDQLDLLDLLD